MRDRAPAFAVALAMAVAAAACGGGPEVNVVNQYFGALKANDTNTLTSFAMVQFDQPVQDWKVVTVGPEAKAPAPLPELVQKQKDIDTELAKNQREFRAWGNDLAVYPKLDELKSIRAKDGKVPSSLQSYAEKYDTYQAKDRELKKQLSEAKSAVERERRNVVLSVGNVEDVETLKGETISKDIDLELTINGEKKPYVMALRKYELDGNTGSRMISRWVVQSLTPKG
jgi:hypothetical protein